VEEGTLSLKRNKTIIQRPLINSIKDSFPDLLKISAISLAASILLNFMKPGFFFTALPISSSD